MTEKYLMLNLNDEKSAKVAEVLNNKTCKKILGVLAEQELSQGDISKELKLPLNTVDYNVKKLVDTGLIEKSKAFFWSVKGKKIPTYKLTNKKILISTKSSFAGMLGSIIGCGAIAGVIKFWLNYKEMLYSAIDLSDNAAISPSSAASKFAESTPNLISNPNYFAGVPFWIIIGLVIGSLAFILYRKMKGGNKI